MLFCQILDCAEAMERMLTVIKLDGITFRGDFFNLLLCRGICCDGVPQVTLLTL